MYNYREKMLFFHEKYVINMIERIITFDFFGIVSVWWYKVITKSLPWLNRNIRFHTRHKLRSPPALGRCRM